MSEERHILHTEHRDDLLKQVENAKKMQALIDLPAWKELLEPAIRSKKDFLMQRFQTEKFDTITEVIAIQQGINSLENLLSCVYEYVKTGAEAAETLKTQGKDSA